MSVCNLQRIAERGALSPSPLRLRCRCQIASSHLATVGRLPRHKKVTGASRLAWPSPKPCD